MKLKQHLIQALIEQAWHVAINKNEVEKLRAEIDSLKVADDFLTDHDQVAEKNMASVVGELNKVKEILAELHQAALPGMRALNPRSAERRRLSMAIGAASTITIPF